MFGFRVWCMGMACMASGMGYDDVEVKCIFVYMYLYIRICNVEL